MQPIHVTLALGKETKGTYRFENNDSEAAISTVYVRKDAFKGEKPPQSIRLLVEAAEPALTR
jgi:hypothetical protein